jgi:hypothetical protein
MIGLPILTSAAGDRDRRHECGNNGENSHCTQLSTVPSFLDSARERG